MNPVGKLIGRLTRLREHHPEGCDCGALDCPQRHPAHGDTGGVILDMSRDYLRAAEQHRAVRPLRLRRAQPGDFSRARHARRDG